MNKQKPITQWHQLLAELLRLMLQELGITVISEHSLLMHSPRADVLLIRRETEDWTAEQLQFLPSGIRESKARHILIEFKKTESLNADVVVKLGAYLLFYLDNNQEIKREDVLPVIVSAKQPRQTTLERLGFVETATKGVYRNENALVEQVQLLSLNRLPDTTYNAYFKLLASQKRTQEKAVSMLQTTGLQHLPTELMLFLASLWRYVFGAKDEEPMVRQMTANQMIEEGRIWVNLILNSLPPDDLLTEIDFKKLLEKIPAEERLSGIPTEERLSGIPTEERLSGIPTEERLSGISAEELEAFLHQLREQEKSAEKDE